MSDHCLGARPCSGAGEMPMNYNGLGSLFSKYSEIQGYGPNHVYSRGSKCHISWASGVDERERGSGGDSGKLEHAWPSKL